MSDEDDGRPARGGNNVNALLAATLGTVSDNPRVDELLDRQIALSDLQIDNLRKEDEFEVSHLRWRRFNDQMKGAMQIMLVAVGLLLVIGIAAAVWNASQADGLVVDSFSVPPSLAAAGVGGDVVADDLTQKIAAIRDFANDNSLARSKDVRQEHDRDVKVEIPETGVSLAEAWRYLKLWLGHERHLSGHVRALPDGRIALTVSLDGADNLTFTGAPRDLDALEERAAERVFATVDPINIVLYLLAKHRNAETLAAAAHLISLGGTPVEQSESYALDANMSRYLVGDLHASVARAQLAISLDPKTAPAHMELLGSERGLGHDEIVLQQARLISTLRQQDNVGSWRTGNGVPYVWQLGALYRAAETGDFADVARQACLYLCSLSDAALQRATAAAKLHDPAQAKTLAAEAITAGDANARDLAQVRYDIGAEMQDWRAAVSDARAISGTITANTAYGVGYRKMSMRTQALPLLARALAMAGDFAGAHHAVDETPGDCYDCLRARGAIDTAEKNWNGAAFWFARAANSAPSIPFAYADWGKMLLARGNTDGAIAKLRLANEKGPHFADTLEIWGEALMRANRSNLALAKFAEAAKYAPNWGRLHLKWGEALFWSGDRDGAQKQFATAAMLYLSPPEKSELAKVRHG
jgi:tetratricopeptide (TPR) repeat protein